MVEFKNPTAFFLLLLLPLLFFLRYVRVFKRLSFLAVLGDWQGDAFEWKGTVFSLLFRFYKLLEILAFVAVVVAYANPVRRHQEKVYISRGADVIFVVDSSPSMAAKDIAGLSRLDAAKKAILTLASENGGCSLGLVSMAREAVLLVPPTMDRDFFMLRMEGLVVGELGDGTAIGTGLSTAVYHLENSQAPKKAIVLITDGENNAGSINPFT
ncbi:MAG: VWA domain-containing protein, partial [Treponema sp.]|nr:VWA domain-containing protein [Treponema sp.]